MTRPDLSKSYKIVARLFCGRSCPEFNDTATLGLDSGSKSCGVEARWATLRGISSRWSWPRTYPMGGRLLRWSWHGRPAQKLPEQQVSWHMCIDTRGQWMSVCSSGHATSLPVQFGFGDSWYHRNKQKHICNISVLWPNPNKKENNRVWTGKPWNLGFVRKTQGFPQGPNAHSSIFCKHVAVIEVEWSNLPLLRSTFIEQNL